MQQQMMQQHPMMAFSNHPGNVTTDLIQQVLSRSSFSFLACIHFSLSLCPPFLLPAPSFSEAGFRGHLRSCCLSVYLFIYLSILLYHIYSALSYTSISVRIYVSLSLSLSLSLYLSVCLLPISLSICLFI